MIRARWGAFRPMRMPTLELAASFCMFLLSACSVHPFCFNCADQPVSDAGLSVTNPDGLSPVTGNDASVYYDAGVPAVVCAGLDLNTDIHNCGTCGHDCPSQSGANLS